MALGTGWTEHLEGMQLGRGRRGTQPQKLSPWFPPRATEKGARGWQEAASGATFAPKAGAKQAVALLPWGGQAPHPGLCAPPSGKGEGSETHTCAKAAAGLLPVSPEKPRGPSQSLSLGLALLVPLHCGPDIACPDKPPPSHTLRRCPRHHSCECVHLCTHAGVHMSTGTHSRVCTETGVCTLTYTPHFSKVTGRQESPALPRDLG